jgi:hypothetical protein
MMRASNAPALMYIASPWLGYGEETPKRAIRLLPKRERTTGLEPATLSLGS